MHVLAAQTPALFPTGCTSSIAITVILHASRFLASACDCHPHLLFLFHQLHAGVLLDCLGREEGWGEELFEGERETEGRAVGFGEERELAGWGNLVGASVAGLGGDLLEG